MRHGPHHSAQKSTSTGSGDDWSTSSKTPGSASIGSATGPSIVLHEPQRTLPGRQCAAATRFFWPHDGQLHESRLSLEAIRLAASRAHGSGRGPSTDLPYIDWPVSAAPLTASDAAPLAVS